MTTQNHKNSFSNIRDQALELGAISAKIISTKTIVIEDRIVLKCKLGCEKYGKTLACPPYAPTPEQFRKIANEYRYALFMKFASHAEGSPDLIPYLSKSDESSIPQEIKSKVDAFWLAWKSDMNKLLNIVLKLEKFAAKEGNILAVGFVSGACQLCEKCNVERGICIHSTLRRFSEEGVGVNVKATAKKAGIKFTLPFEKNPETYALLLIE